MKIIQIISTLALLRYREQSSISTEGHEEAFESESVEIEWIQFRIRSLRCISSYSTKAALKAGQRNKANKGLKVHEKDPERLNQAL